ncbi:uncharacterized protein CDV56_107106 [Aspergillus thermomutatus]|uniref:Uncharacterized protein n=1 Tax=Aspergillus thermomutatus TaxID=41047 RepID=A0A397HBC7_ASPTH|nr:uncharacterized protein CDV56_107106 [Aspergillus thermomutatus]RHZ60362.1 hypothetical protein CDV56_107106 [Aspergillus thermomutatus]
MKAVITILTTAMAMTALAVPYRGARDSESAETDTTLVPTPTSELLAPAESAETVHIHSTNVAIVTVTPAPSASSNSTPASKGNAEEASAAVEKDAKTDHIIGSVSELMFALRCGHGLLVSLFADDDCD